MQAIEYVKSVPRYLTARLLGPRWPAVYTSRFGTLRLTHLEPPRLPGSHWVRVRPRLAGICGSDLATLTAQGSPYFAPLTSYPFVFGHEVVGEVTEVGLDVDQVRVGDRVVLEPPLHCGVREIASPCAACRAGRPSHCLNVTRGAISAGIQVGFCHDTGGGWSESFIAHETQLHRVPADLPDEVAVLTEPFACCLHAALAPPIGPESTILVLGSGTIGLLTLAAVRATGSTARVVAVAKYPHQRRLAMALGADIALDTRDLQEQLASTLGAKLYQAEIGGPTALGGADVVFECVGSERSLDDALRFTRWRGSVILVGMPSVPRHVDWTAIWHKELLVQGAYTSTTPTFTRALASVGTLRETLASLVSARYPLGQYREAIRGALHAGSAGLVKTVFEP
jgi:threonine dehydrogenase-like Zn-dependent dehydrogenase